VCISEVRSGSLAPFGYRLISDKTSALVRIADSSRTSHHVRKVPVGDIDHLVGAGQQRSRHDRPSALAVFRLMTVFELRWPLDLLVAALQKEAWPHPLKLTKRLGNQSYVAQHSSVLLRSKK
jgi:hypothetical protein